MVSSTMSRLLQRRLLSTAKPSSSPGVKQVTRSNFAEALEEIKPLISASQYVAVSLTTTGSYASTWHKVSAFDTPETAYLKSKFAAGRFQVLQLAVCPFSVSASKVTAHPYNFHLFPRDELKLRMPCYSFSCQSSSLSSMARQGFDFNTCIYDGISYLSREQESSARILLGSPMPAVDVSESVSAPSIADSVFVERMRSRVRHWRDAHNDSNSGKKDDVLVKSLRKILAGSEEYKSRPSLTIDVCSERQAQLVVKMVLQFADDMVPLLIQAKRGVIQAVRVVLTRSKEDKDLLLRETEELEVERNKKARGFREVIDFISDSQKPVVSHNSLDDLTFIHAKFLAPLPATVDDFMCSLRLAFPQVINVNHLMKVVSPTSRGKNILVAMGHLKNHFFAPIDLEIPDQATLEEDKIHGHAVVRISQLFAKLCQILKFASNTNCGADVNVAITMEPYANMFDQYTTDSQEPSDGEVKVWSNNTRKVNYENVVFLWGFRDHITAGTLKSLLQESHILFITEFDVRLVEKSCAIIVFWQPGLSNEFLQLMNKVRDISGGPLTEMVSEGVRAADYRTYNRVCRLGLWEASLGEALDKALDTSSSTEYESIRMSGNGHHHREWIINFDDL